MEETASLTSMGDPAPCPFSSLWQEIMQSHFLQGLQAPEMLFALAARRARIQRLLFLITEELTHVTGQNERSRMILNHLRTLLEAELAWLDLIIAHLPHSILATAAEADTMPPEPR
jgi:hypothetical protein